MFQQPSAESLQFLYEEPSFNDGPLTRAHRDAQEQEHEQLLMELQPLPKEEVSLKVGQRGIYLNLVVRPKAEAGLLSGSQDDYRLAA